MGHNFWKNQWIKTKFRLDLYHGMAKQCTKYQMNICKQSDKSEKLIIRDIFPSRRAITSGKINGSKPNSNLFCVLVWQNNVPNIKWIICKQKEKSGKLIIRDIFLSPWAKTFEKSMDRNQTQTWSVSWYGKAMYQISNEYL